MTAGVALLAATSAVGVAAPLGQLRTNALSGIAAAASTTPPLFLTYIDELTDYGSTLSAIDRTPRYAMSNRCGREQRLASSSAAVLRRMTLGSLWHDEAQQER
jgi:hypothetical protein